MPTPPPPSADKTRQDKTIQCNAMQCNTIHYNAIQCNTIQYHSIISFDKLNCGVRTWPLKTHPKNKGQCIFDVAHSISDCLHIPTCVVFVFCAFESLKGSTLSLRQ